MDEGTPTLLEAKTSVILFFSKKASKDACTVLWIGAGRDYGNTTKCIYWYLKLKKKKNQQTKTNPTKKKNVAIFLIFLRPNKHLHDVIQFCEIHFERLIWSYWLTAVRSESF